MSQLIKPSIPKNAQSFVYINVEATLVLLEYYWYKTSVVPPFVRRPAVVSLLCASRQLQSSGLTLTLIRRDTRI